jgi:hypothetical protein
VKDLMSINAFIKNVIVRVIVALISAVILFCTYLVYKSIKLPENIYMILLFAAQALLMWFILKKVED